MKTLGILGGMSWESTAIYYRFINEAVRAQRGGLHSAPLVIQSVDFESIAALQRSQRWDDAGALLGKLAQDLVAGGAQAILIATNTMHRVAPAVSQAVPHVPLLHIADATADALRLRGCRQAGVLATRFTMEQPFYRDHLLRQHGMDMLVPDEGDRIEVHRVIFEELCQGRVLPASRQRAAQIMQRLIARGADCIVLGCTELCMLLGDDDADVPIIDSTQAHVNYAVAWAMRD